MNDRTQTTKRRHQLQPYEAVAYATALVVPLPMLKKILVEAKQNVDISTSDREWATVEAALTMLCNSSK